MLLCVEVRDVCLTVTNAGGEVAGICLGGRRSVLASRPWLGGIGGLGFFSVRPCVRCCGFPHEVTLGVSDSSGGDPDSQDFQCGPAPTDRSAAQAGTRVVSRHSASTKWKPAPTASEGSPGSQSQKAEEMPFARRHTNPKPPKLARRRTEAGRVPVESEACMACCNLQQHESCRSSPSASAPFFGHTLLIV